MSEQRVVTADLLGTVVSIGVKVGDVVRDGQPIGMIESMKLHHDIVANATGAVTRIDAPAGTTVKAGEPVLAIDTSVNVDDEVATETATSEPRGLDRPDLADVIDRHRLGTDDERPDAVARRRERGRRTARENVEHLVDNGSFVEYGPLAIAAQKSRRSHDDLIRRTPGDGLIGGIGTVNGEHFGEAARTVVATYDYTVLAGTQGHRNHLKKDKLFEVAGELELPVVLFTEGGGGRPGDTDTGIATGLNSLAFGLLAELSGKVPVVGVNAGYCFAGNAALLGCCDVVIATKDSNIGMAGPAMIEGGGLGKFAPTEIGPIDVQQGNGVVDLVADDEAHAVELAKQYLSYFQGRTTDVEVPDQEALRDVVPVDRLRSYPVRDAIEGIFDAGSVLELRKGFGNGMVTALARLDGRPVGVLANDPAHLAGAIDSEGSDKAARFMQLCDAHGLPLITVVDTPGMMVGPDVEATGLVRHCSRLFVTGANITVPVISLVTRKAYGLGAQAMMAGSTKAPLACLAWPTGEFGPMGLEGAVHLGYRAELDACETEADRAALFDTLVAKLYERGKAISIAEFFEIDDVIDPADTRRWLSALLESAPPRRGAYPYVDTW